MAKDEDVIVKTTLRLPHSLLLATKHRALDEGLALQDVIIKAIEQYLQKSKGGRK